MLIDRQTPLPGPTVTSGIICTGKKLSPCKDTTERMKGVLRHGGLVVSFPPPRNKKPKTKTTTKTIKKYSTEQ
jgi:hypothetical protein